jgi:hypothetical protein
MLDSLSGFFCPGSETVIEDSVLKAHVAEEKKKRIFLHVSSFADCFTDAA